MSTNTATVREGVYTHHKGGQYRVLFVATESTNSREGRRVVVYVSLTYGTIKCRDLTEFVEHITWPDGSKRPRFVLASDVYPV